MSNELANPMDRTSVSKGDKRNLDLLTSLFLIFVSVAVVAVLTALVYIASQNNANGNRLIDCTTPGGKCYESSQKQTGKAIGTINEVSMASDFCSLKIDPPYTNEDFDTFLICVKALVDRR